MKIDQLYVLRFIAAVLVVFYHYFTHVFDHTPFGIFAHHGNEAVNFFYIISGYVMVLSYNNRLNNVNDYKQFWISRIRRIYPVYILALAILMLYVVTIDSSLFSSLKVRLLLETFLLQSWIGKTSVNYPGWSVSVEIFFYLLFPYIFKYVKNKKVITNIFIFFTLYIFIQGLYYFIFTKNISNKENIATFVDYSPYFHIVTFYLGIVVGLFYLRYYPVMVKNKLMYKTSIYAAIAIISFIVIYIVRAYNIQYTVFYRNVGVLAPLYALFLVAFSLDDFFTRLYSNKFFIFLGDISYSLYILQYPVMLFVIYVIKQNGIPFMLEYFSILILFTILVHYLYERQASLLIKKFFSTANNIIVRPTKNA